MVKLWPFVLFFCSFLLSLPLQAQPEETTPPTSTEVSFSNGEIPLVATLVIPGGAGPFPGVVIVHGSGSSDRSNPWTSAYATALAARGVAVLYPDKRGSGASGGEWQAATFQDLAADALAGHQVLRAHPLVDSSRVGLIGFSQGGYVIPVAAAQAPEIAFVVSVSGSVAPMLQQVADEVRLAGERAGLSPVELGMLASIHDLAARYVHTGEGWDEYAEALAEAKRGRLAGMGLVEGFPAERDSPVWSYFRLIGDFDPLPYWRELRVPALFLYGGRDENVDVYRSADLVESSLTPTSLPYSLLLFRNNGHALFREDAMDFIARWVRDGGAD